MEGVCTRCCWQLHDTYPPGSRPHALQVLSLSVSLNLIMPIGDRDTWYGWRQMFWDCALSQNLADWCWYLLKDTAMLTTLTDCALLLLMQGFWDCWGGWAANSISNSFLYGPCTHLGRGRSRGRSDESRDGVEDYTEEQEMEMVR
jgi:hypothetical protein